MEIRPCKPPDYAEFVRYSYLKSIPSPGSLCFLGVIFSHHNVMHDCGFIAYSPARHKICPRLRYLPGFNQMPPLDRRTWLGSSVCELSRLVIKPEFAYHGLGTELVASTISRTGKRYVEIVTASEPVMALARKLGFRVHAYSRLRPDWSYCLLEIHKTAI